MSENLLIATDQPIGRLGRYALLENLAKGGMAQVYIAQKDGADDVCVLKQLLVELEENEVAAKRFHREAHVASYLVHPNIARITDAGVEDNTFCIAFEFIPGKDGESMMHKLLPAGRMLPYEVSLAMALGVLDGLAYAHQAKDPSGKNLGLVHRDLSPRNMMLSYEGDVKIIDFGLAHGNVDDFRTAPGMVLGTLRYVSPEQALTEPVDRRSDLYSLSVVLHEMLSGRWLIQPGKPFEVLKGVVTDVPPLVTELNPHLPAELGPVIRKGLSKAPEDRWQTAEEYQQALKQAAGDLADTAGEVLGQFVRDLFPEDVERALRWTAQGRRRYSSIHRGRSSSQEATLEPGKFEAPVLPADLSSPDEAGATRTGYVGPTPTDDLSPTRVFPQDMPTDPSVRTRTGYVEPGQITAIDEAARTRLDPADERTRVQTDGEDTIIPTLLVDSDTQLVAEPRHGSAIPRGPMLQSIMDSGPAQTRRSSGTWSIVVVLVLIAGVLGVIVVGLLRNDPNQGVSIESASPLKLEQPEPQGLGVVAGKAEKEPARVVRPPKLEKKAERKSPKRVERKPEKRPERKVEATRPKQPKRPKGLAEVEKMVRELHKESGDGKSGNSKKFRDALRKLREVTRRDLSGKDQKSVDALLGAASRSNNVGKLKKALGVYKRAIQK